MIAFHILFHILRVDPAAFDLPSLLAQFVALSGFAALTAAVVNVGKYFKIVKDGQAPQYSLIINTLGFVGLVALRVFKPDADISAADQTTATISQILVYVLALVTQFGVSKASNAGLRGMPIIGHTNTPQG